MDDMKRKYRFKTTSRQVAERMRSQPHAASSAPVRGIVSGNGTDLKSLFQAASRNVRKRLSAA